MNEYKKKCIGGIMMLCIAAILFAFCGKTTVESVIAMTQGTEEQVVVVDKHSNFTAAVHGSSRSYYMTVKVNGQEQKMKVSYTIYMNTAVGSKLDAKVKGDCIHLNGNYSEFTSFVLVLLSAAIGIWYFVKYGNKYRNSVS